MNCGIVITCVLIFVLRLKEKLKSDLIAVLMKQENLAALWGSALPGVLVFSTVVLIGDTINRETHVELELKILFKMLAGGRLTSGLFTRHGRVEFVTTEIKSI